MHNDTDKAGDQMGPKTLNIKEPNTAIDKTNLLNSASQSPHPGRESEPVLSINVQNSKLVE